MMEVLKDYLQFGPSGTTGASTWSLVIAAVLIALTILRRQSDD